MWRETQRKIDTVRSDGQMNPMLPVRAENILRFREPQPADRDEDKQAQSRTNSLSPGT
jgi:hypothetical protein